MDIVRLNRTALDKELELDHTMDCLYRHPWCAVLALSRAYEEERAKVSMREEEIRQLMIVIRKLQQRLKEETR